MDRPDELCRMSFGRLLLIPNLGVRSALELAVMLELHLPKEVLTEQGQSEEDLAIDDERKRGLLIGAAAQPFADVISGQDSRFPMLGASRVVLSDRIEDAIERDDYVAIDFLVKTLPAVTERVREIQSLKLEDALLELFTGMAKRYVDRVPELIHRFGWDGEPPETLEAVGRRLGVTRERIRQIQKKLVQRIPTHRVFVPQLQDAINALEEVAPVPVGVASIFVQKRGISDRPFHPKSIIAAAHDCNFSTSLKIRSVRGKKLLTAKTDGRVISRLATIARAQSGASGATDITEVLEQAREEGLSFEEKRATRLVRNLPDLHWLVDGWFFVTSVPTERNRLRNIARKMLSVTSPMHAKTIRAGMRRVAAWRNSTLGSERWPFRAPPAIVVQKFLEEHPEFEVDAEGLVSPAEDLDYTVELGAVERAIVEAIRSTPSGVLDRQSIRDKCTRRGVNAHTLEVLMTYSPIVEHLGVNLWSIAGVTVDPAAVEAVRAANALRPKEKRVTDFGWTEEGNVWISVIVPSYHTSSFVFGIPGGVKKYLIGQRFTVLDASGKEFGQFAVNDDGTAYGAGSFLRRKGADTGDVILCEFNLPNNTVVLTIGGDEILQDM